MDERERSRRREGSVFIEYYFAHLHSSSSSIASSITSKATIYDTETISQGRQTAGRIFNNQYP
eukprot:scaffold695_cov279-Chaetoceros_neogracile.AAC.55